MSSIWYGSLTNRIEERAKSPTPAVGMGATEYCWSDRHAYEIIEVKDDRHITVRAYTCKRIDKNGMSECQDYEYIPNPNGHIAHLFKTLKGEWRERYSDRTLGCNRWGIGRAEEYYDYSF